MSTKISLDQRRLRRFDERNHLHLAAALGARQRVYLVYPLDQHRPRLAAPAWRRPFRRLAARRRADPLPPPSFKPPLNAPQPRERERDRA